MTHEQIQRELDAIVKRSVSPQQIANDALAFAKTLKEQGMAQLEMYDIFESYYLSMRDEESENISDAVEEVLSFIWGWCPSDVGVFPTSISNGELAQYRRDKVAQNTQ